MRRTRFTEQQIVGGRIKLNPGYRLRFVREAPDFGSDVIQLDGEIRWAERLGPEALEKLDAENAKLKKVYAELAIENEAIKAVLN